MNQITISGNLGKDAELQTVGESSLLKFSVATSEKWKNKQGELQEETTWHNCALWSRPNLEKYLTKGTKVIISGKQEHRKHEDKYYASIKVRQIELIGGKPSTDDEIKSEDKAIDDLPF